MNEDSSDMNLELALSSSNQSARQRLNTSSGAGVNADSKIENTVVGSYPLYDSVWSTHKGLSLKCSDSSLTDKISFPLWSGGTSNVVLPHIHVIKSIGASDNSVTDKKLAKTDNFAVNGEVAAGTYLAKGSSSSYGYLFESSHAHHTGNNYNEEDLNPVEKESAVHLNENQDQNYEDQAFCCPKDIQFEDVAGTSKTSAGKKCQELTNSLTLTNKAKHEQVHEKVNGKKKISCSGKIDEFSIGTQMLDLKAHSLENAPLEGPESFSKDNVKLVIEKDACRKSEKGYQVERSCPVDVFGPPEDNEINVFKEQGGEIILIVNDVNLKLSKDEDDSHESIESCNSATLSSKVKKRRSSEQQSVIRSKRSKSLSKEAPSSTSAIKPDSSFMNWISNMVKGLAKSTQDECPRVLSLNHFDQRLEFYDRKNPACDKTNDPGSGNMGFQSIFQSLYLPNTISSERTSDDYPSVSGTKESSKAGKSFMNVMPISFFRENDEYCKQFLIENSNLNHRTSGNIGDLSAQTSTQPHILCANHNSPLETSKTESVGKNDLRVRCSNGIRLTGALLGKQKLVSYEGNSSHLPAESKVIPNMCNNDDPLKSLWITRFSSRTTCSPLDFDHSSSTHIMLEDSSGCKKHIPQHRVNYSFIPKYSEAAETCSKYPVDAVSKDNLNYITSIEASTGFNRVVGHKHDKPIYIPKSQSPTYKSLEPMASEFARRLEVLKTIPSDAKDDVPTVKTTCVFCFRSGHDICSCSEVQEAELEDLMINISPEKTADTVQLQKRSEPFSGMFLTNESRCQVAGDHSSCSGKTSKVFIRDRKVLSLDEVENHIPLHYKELDMKEDQLPPLPDSTSKPVSADALNMFDAVRKLRLSRMDILKWRNSHMSLSHLDGFFLQLRLRNWEAGPGGTEYSVAYIYGNSSESQREMMPKGPDRSLYVNVGHTKCFVESQYISNHDFSEEELMDWWHTISKAGEIPSVDDLRSKFKEKQNLGL